MTDGLFMRVYARTLSGQQEAEAARTDGRGVFTDWRSMVTVCLSARLSRNNRHLDLNKESSKAAARRGVNIQSMLYPAEKIVDEFNAIEYSGGASTLADTGELAGAVFVPVTQQAESARMPSATLITGW